jgi:outer membrane protein OmpA-like peptidoglycan-associated protein
MLFFFCLLTSSCIKRPFVPENVGREYGNPTTPWVVSHLPEKNQWALARSKPHNVFQRILCFSYPCRKMIGRRKALNAISFKAFVKQIEKNAKRGLYKSITPSPSKKIEPDSIIIQNDTSRLSKKKIISEPSSAILKKDSLITLSEFLFETDSYKLKVEHFSELDLLSIYLIAHPTLAVSISGHTDTIGNERHNVALSTRRAEVVAAYLISKGVTFEKVTFKGFGSSQPISGNETATGRSKNRRVEILIRNSKSDN